MSLLLLNSIPFFFSPHLSIGGFGGFLKKSFYFTPSSHSRHSPFLIFHFSFFNFHCRFAAISLIFHFSFYHFSFFFSSLRKKELSLRRRSHKKGEESHGWRRHDILESDTNALTLIL